MQLPANILHGGAATLRGESAIAALARSGDDSPQYSLSRFEQFIFALLSSPRRTTRLLSIGNENENVHEAAEAKESRSRRQSGDGFLPQRKRIAVHTMTATDE